MRRSCTSSHAGASLAFPPSAPGRPGVVENTGSQSARAHFGVFRTISHNERSVLRIFAALLAIMLSFASGSALAEDMRAGASPILERASCEFPFKDYREWLAFADEAQSPAWQSAAMQQLFDKESFDRYRGQVLTTCDKIVYSSDGLKINGFIIAPRDLDAPAPVILFAHGGVAQWGRIIFFELLEMHRLAEQGYVVIASTLRGEGGSEGSPNLGAGDLADMLRLIDVAEHIEGADASRVGVWGFSRGGGLGYRMLAASDRISAAVLIGAPSDSVNSERREEFHEHVYPGVVDGYEENQDEALANLSAVYWPERLAERTPVLLLHGADDVRVPVADSLTMAAKLAQLDRPFRLVVAQDGSHSLIEHQKDVRAEMDRWFETYLKSSPEESGQ